MSRALDKRREVCQGHGELPPSSCQACAAPQRRTRSGPELIVLLPRPAELQPPDRAYRLGGKRIGQRWYQRTAYRSLISSRLNLKSGGKDHFISRSCSSALFLDRSRPTLKSRLPAMEISISSPSLRSRASTTTAGRRTAKLLPHLETCIKDIPNPLYIHASLEATCRRYYQRDESRHLGVLFII